MKPEQKEKFLEALLSAFPTRSSLERMLDLKLGWRLEELAGPLPLRDTVFAVLKHAEAIGKEEALVRAAYKENPGNSRLRQFFWEYVGEEPPREDQARVGVDPAAPRREAERPFSLVYCYASADSGAAGFLENQLSVLVRDGLIDRPWSEGMIQPGANRREAIQRRWSTADVILLLVSADFMAEEDEYLRMAKERRTNGAVVIPIILRPTLWDLSWLGELQACPRKGGVVKPVSTWRQADEAWINVIRGLRTILTARKAVAAGP
jgi:hypothetical protein